MPHLRVVGDGPMAPDVQQAASRLANLEAVGRVPRDVAIREIQNASAVVVPSIWYESFGLTLVEAFACGVPVIASRLGSMAEIVRDGETGLLFEPGNSDDLAEKVRWAHEHPEAMRAMGKAARAEFEAKYTEQANYVQMMEIYESAIATAREMQPHGARRRDAQPSA
jgi:glycosyltransferase involved in cell wall biosynthesis